MKKIFFVLLLTLSLTACGDKSEAEGAGPSAETGTQTEENSDAEGSAEEGGDSAEGSENPDSAEGETAGDDSSAETGGDSADEAGDDAAAAEAAKIKPTSGADIDFTKFPNTAELLTSLGVDKSAVEKVAEDETQLSFVFPDKAGESETYYEEAYEFAKGLEEKGYTLELADGTVTSVIMLKNETQSIFIRTSQLVFYDEYVGTLDLDKEKYANGVVEINAINQ